MNVLNQSMFLMCPPTYYKLVEPDPIHGHPNDMNEQFYDQYMQDPHAFSTRAHEQWRSLHQLLTRLGIGIELLEPVHDCEDQVFTADASLSLTSDFGAVSLISQFAHWGRQAETVYHQDIIERLYPNRFITSSYSKLEGTGDNVYDSFRDVFWCGYAGADAGNRISAGRSEQAGHKELLDATSVATVSLEVQRPFFHLDTTLTPLSNGHLLLFKDGLSAQAYDIILEQGIKRYGLNVSKYLIEINEEEARAYACNLINLGNTIIMPACGNRLPALLTRLGYHVYTVDVSAFIAAGGGPHCLVNNITQQRVVGGSWRNGLMPGKTCWVSHHKEGFHGY